MCKPVGKLDQDDPDVLGHGHDHLAEVVRLALLAALELHAGQLGHAVHEHGHLVAEEGRDLLLRDGGVLDGIVQQAGGYRRRHRA